MMHVLIALSAKSPSIIPYRVSFIFGTLLFDWLDSMQGSFLMHEEVAIELAQYSKDSMGQFTMNRTVETDSCC